jgi:hypothetical protein
MWGVLARWSGSLVRRLLGAGEKGGHGYRVNEQGDIGHVREEGERKQERAGPETSAQATTAIWHARKYFVVRRLKAEWTSEVNFD